MLFRSNDAPVLARADIGIAMGALGSDAAIEAADVVLMDDDPGKIVTALAIARKCMAVVYQNIIFSIGIKVGCLTRKDLCGLPLPQPPLSQPSWPPADKCDVGGRACRLAGSSGLWAAGLIQGQTWLPSSLPFGDQPPGVYSNEQAAFSSYILVSPPFENKTLPHLLASGIAIIAWRIIGGNSI